MMQHMCLQAADDVRVTRMHLQTPIRLVHIVVIFALGFVLTACGGSGGSATSVSTSPTQSTPEAAQATPPQSQPTEEVATATATPTAIPPTETPSSTSGLPEDAQTALNESLDPKNQEYTIDAAVRLERDVEFTLKLSLGFLGSINETQLIPGASGEAYCVATSPAVKTKLRIADISAALDEISKLGNGYNGTETYTESRFLVLRGAGQSQWFVKPGSVVDFFTGETAKGWNQLCGFEEGQPGFLPLPTATPSATPVEGATGRIVFEDGLKSLIYSVAFPNTTAVALLADGIKARLPVLSPDGSKVAFLYTKGTNFNQLRVGLISSFDGGAEPVQLGTFVGAIRGLTWSPDGKQIAFTVVTGSNLDKSTIYTVDITDPGKETLVAEYVSYQPGDILWMPDGKSFLTISKSTSPCANGCAHTFDLATKTGSLMEPLKSVNVVQPVLSPDGKKLAFLTGRGGTIGYTISILDFDTGEITKFGDLVVENAIGWTPDGSALAVVLGGGFMTSGRPQLYLIKQGANTVEDATLLFNIKEIRNFTWGKLAN
ncbi:MAG: PD40 domain-containing protein [Anaerolineae bacterium]|nr:PD40 domain-containing protein [Anaerolineae bacterium]